MHLSIVFGRPYQRFCLAFNYKLSLSHIDFYLERDSHDHYFKPQLSCAVHLYKDECKKHQAQPDNAFIMHKAALSIKELGIKDSVTSENRASFSR